MVLVAHSGIIHAVVAGMVGVTLFFVLSGFLITYLLLEESERTGRIDLPSFYGRRVLRLLPALSVYLVGIALITWTVGIAVPVWDMTWPPALYVANYVQIFDHDIFFHRHTWSLAVEEHFYLVWPLLVLLGATRKLKALAVAVGILGAWRLVAGLVDPMWAYHSTDTNAYALGLGCLVAVAYHGGWRPPVPKRTAEAGIVALVFMSLMPFHDLDHLYTIGVWLPPLAALAAAVCILGALEREPAFLRGKALGWLGLVSYSLYLWHAPLLQLPQLAATPGLRLLAVGLALGIAGVSWRFIEGPIMRSKLRRRLTTHHPVSVPSTDRV